MYNIKELITVCSLCANILTMLGDMAEIYIPLLIRKCLKNRRIYYDSILLPLWQKILWFLVLIEILFTIILCIYATMLFLTM